MTEITRKVRVYLASPFTHGSPTINTRFQAKMLAELVDEGIVFPVAPLAFAHFNMIVPREERFWLDYDLGLLEMCDCVLRLNATCDEMPRYLVTQSSGADGEEKHAVALGLPIFYSKADLYAWANTQVHLD